jgi:hypothetical protein
MRNASDLTQVVCAIEAAAFAVRAVHDVTGVRPSRVPPTRSSDQAFWGAGVPSIFLTVSRVPGGAWWWHTEDDTVETADEANLVRDTRIYLLGALRLATCRVLPYEFGSSAQELSKVLEGLVSRAQTLDLTPVREALRRFERAALGIEDRLQDLGDVQGAEGMRSLEGVCPAAIRSLNRKLLEASRAVVRVTYTEGSRFHHDPAVPMRLLPSLAEASRLESLDPAGGEAHMLKTKLVRKRNRVVTYLTEAASVLEEALDILDSKEDA